MSVWGYNGYVAELGSYQSEQNVSERLFGADALKWHIIKWGMEQGYREYDLTGMANNPDSKEQAIRQFKEKYANTVKPYLVVSKK